MIEKQHQIFNLVHVIYGCTLVFEVSLQIFGVLWSEKLSSRFSHGKIRALSVTHFLSSVGNSRFLSGDFVTTVKQINSQSDNQI